MLAFRETVGLLLAGKSDAGEKGEECPVIYSPL